MIANDRVTDRINSGDGPPSSGLRMIPAHMRRVDAARRIQRSRMTGDERF